MSLRLSGVRASAASLPAPAALLQRKCACEGSDHACEECRKKGTLQRKAAGGDETESVSPIVHEVLCSPGQPLEADTRTIFQPRFGHDFGHVRLHTDARSAESACAMNARAYTVGRDIVFNAGRYQPATTAGRAMLGHELAHVVQQSRGGVGGEAERRARSVGERVARGERILPAEVGRAPVSLQRADGEESKAETAPAAAVARPHRLDGFVKDSAELTPDHLSSIDSLAWSIALHLRMLVGGKVGIKVIGHTDTTGSDRHNTGLGLKRAEAAKGALEAALRADQVAEDQIAPIIPESAGERKLAVPTKDNVDEPRNRRVEFEVTITQAPAPSPQPPKPGPPNLGLPPTYAPPLPGPFPGTPIPGVPPPSREWLKKALEDDPLLKKLPGFARDKAIDALKDADELAADKVIDALPWDDKEKQAAKAAIKAILQLIKGRKFQVPEVPPRQPDWGPAPTFPSLPGERIFKFPPLRFNWP